MRHSRQSWDGFLCLRLLYYAASYTSSHLRAPDSSCGFITGRPLHQILFTHVSLAQCLRAYMRDSNEFLAHLFNSTLYKYRNVS